jgi:GPH family glycoside/pentoside/hexuronide:cation symporter
MSAAPAAPASKPASAPKPDGVPVGVKLACGAPQMVDNLSIYLPKQMASPVFNMAMGVAPSQLSFLFMLFRFWDAFTNPLVGWLSDQTRSRFGRRKPYILIGGILTATAFPLMWFVPRSWSTSAMGWWVMATGLWLYACYSVWNVPYNGLVTELTRDYNERTRISAIRGFFAKTATIAIGWSWAFTQLPCFNDPATGKPDTLSGMRTLSLIVGAVILVCAVLPVFFAKEERYADALAGGKTPFWKSLGHTLSNRPFLILIGVVLLYAAGIFTTGGLTIYVVRYHVYGGDAKTASIMTGWIATIANIAGLISVPIFSKICVKIGKTRTLVISVLLVSTASVLTWVTYTPSNPWFILFSAVLGIPGHTALWIALPAMSADTVDYDELHTGRRNEGMYSAMFGWWMKCGAAVGFGLTGPLLEWTGFLASLGNAQTPEALFRLRALFAFLPAAAMLSSLILLRFYKLSPARMTEVRSELERRRATG